MENYPHVDKQAAEKPEKVAAGTATIEGLTGLGAVALSIIGLANIYPMVLVAVSTIALGAALLFEAGSVAARFSALMAETKAPSGSYSTGRWGGMTTGFLGGAAGIALGILSLLGIAPMILVPIAAIVYGFALIMDSGVRTRLAALESQFSGLSGLSQEVARETATASSGIQLIVGLGAITLGILALVGISSLALSLVAMLIVSAAVLLSGSVAGGRMVSMFRS